MAQLNQMELQNLRQIIGSQEMASQKFQAPPNRQWIRRCGIFLSSRLRTRRKPSNS